jgi:dienelactone hydrolase
VHVGSEEAIVETSDIAYAVDGREMVGRLALPDGEGSRPGVLIAHAGGGLDDFQKQRAEGFAERLGYVAFALDYYGGGKPLQDRAEIDKRLRIFSDQPERGRSVATAGLDVLLAQPRVDRTKIAAVGYCFGGALVLELARTGADVKAVVGFHPGLGIARTDSTNIVGKVLMCVGADDPKIPVEHRVAFEAEMRAAGVDWRMNLYGGALHSFTNPRAALVRQPGSAYDKTTDERSWRAMLDLFDEVFGQGSAARS